MRKSEHSAPVPMLGSQSSSPSIQQREYATLLHIHTHTHTHSSSSSSSSTNAAGAAIPGSMDGKQQEQLVLFQSQEALAK